MKILHEYPSINQFRTAISAIKSTFKTTGNNELIPLLKFKGTTKVHGANYSVVMPENYPQSKNQVLDSLKHKNTQSSSVQKWKKSKQSTRALHKT